eukprot:356681-Chlamydomonas_euryale.AAC.2
MSKEYKASKPPTLRQRVTPQRRCLLSQGNVFASPTNAWSQPSRQAVAHPGAPPPCTWRCHITPPLALGGGPWGAAPLPMGVLREIGCQMACWQKGKGQPNP